MPPGTDQPAPGSQRLPGLRKFAAALIAANRSACHRQVLIVAGERDWCLRQAELLLAPPQLSEIAWLGDRPPTGITPLAAAQARQVLGGEVDALVVDAWAGFDPDAFGATIGAVHGGGLVVLLTPPLASWPDYVDPATERIATYPYTCQQITGRYLQRLTRLIRSSSEALVLEPDKSLPEISTPAVSRPDPAPARRQLGTADQQRAVVAIERCASGHRHRPVVLTSDRGRGKSAALGIAAAQLLRTGVARIIVTASSLNAAAAVFTHAQQLLPEAYTARGYISTDQATLEFVAPDELLRHSRSAHLLLVDEAATIPTAVLTALLKRYARLVFASTVHGYEGTGRGFALRFREVLDRHTPHWRELRLETPIRWASDDPAERFAFRALLLNAWPAPDAALTEATAAECRAEALDRDALIAEERLLSELFGLLVLAHYRTTPADLRQLLDAPELSVWVLRYQNHVAAAALVVDEGGLPAELARTIWLGLRRPRGHLVAQSLAAHGGLAQAPTLYGRRVLRIAVHPACQNRRLGTRLLGDIFDDARGRGIDYLAAAFGATTELLRFWIRSAMRVVRLGSHREASTGHHGAIMLRPLSPAGERFVNTAQARFADRLPDLLSEPLHALDPELALMLLQNLGSAGTLAPTPGDWDDLLAFGFGRRQYNDAMVALRRLTRYTLPDPQRAAALSRSQQLALLARVLQQRDWSELAGYLEVAGRRPVVATLRHAVRRLALTSPERQVRRQACELLHVR